METPKIAGFDRKEVLRALEIMDVLTKQEMAKAMTSLRANLTVEYNPDDPTHTDFMHQNFSACEVVSKCIIIKQCLTHLRSACF
jgi:hypothetical protein